MTIPLSTSGGLFTRLGHIFGDIQDINAIRGGAATARVLSGANMVTRFAQHDTDYLASPANQALVDGIYQTLTQFQNVQAGTLTALVTLATNTVVKMADQDVALTSKTLTNALKLLISQMTTAAASVQSSTVAAGAQTAVGSPSGTPIITLSLIDPKDGLTHEYVFPETLTFTCIRDSQNGATAGQETLSVTGPATVQDSLSFLWPGGSGVNQNLSAVDSLQNNSGGNLLINSDFETFTTANTPDNWTIAVGTAGVTVFSSASSYTGSKCLQITGTGSESTTLTQTTNVSSGGTPAKLAQQTGYAVNLRVKVSATPSAGVMSVSLVDGSGTTINDQAGNANSFNVALTGLSTSYVAFSGFFRMPAILPATVKLQLKLTTALDNTKSAFVDNLAMTPARQLYSGGPWCGIFAGASKMYNGDAWTRAITNTYGVFQQYFERAFGMRGLGLKIPSSGSPTVADSLIA